jgi:UDP-glucuronate 4-epimerase
MSSYLVTGAAGFIGGAVAELLLSQGHNVTGIDNLNDAYDVRLKHWRLDRLKACRAFRFVHLDICDRDALRGFWDGAGPMDAVINLAARAGVRYSAENPWIYVDANVTGTLNLLEGCRARGIRKLILSSTSSLYGGHNPLPYREDADITRPLSPYAATKQAAESLCHAYHHLYGIDITIFRYFTVYGPAGRPDMSVFRFVKWVAEGEPVRIYGDGSQSRDFTYVSDIARGTVAAIPLGGYQIINLGSDRPIVLRDLLNAVGERLGRTPDVKFFPAHAADVPATWADIGQARTLLNWSPETGIEQGLDSFVTWYRANRDWASQIQLG